MARPRVSHAAGGFQIWGIAVADSRQGSRFIGPCQHGMARPRVSDVAGSLQIWSIAATILNKQLRTANKGSSSRLGVGRGANYLSP